MEKRKLLLIVISVGVFLVIVIGATILVFAPPSVGTAVAARGSQSQANAQPSGPATVDASEWVRNPSTVPGLQDSVSPGTGGRGDVIIIYGDRPGQSESAGQSGSTEPPTDMNGEGGSVISVPAPDTVAVPEPEPKTEIKDQGVKTAPKPAAPVKPAETKSVAVKTPPKKAPKIVDDFWVQTGSFSAKTRADAAKETLSAKGIASLVETKEVDGKTFYRVRVGPYASKSEAEYWLSLVKTIEGFDESYVSLTKSRR